MNKLFRGKNFHRSVHNKNGDYFYLNIFFLSLQQKKRFVYFIFCMTESVKKIFQLLGTQRKQHERAEEEQRMEKGIRRGDLHEKL